MWARLGAYALEAGRDRDAYAWLQNALRHASPDAATWTNFGTAALRLSRPPEAIAAYRNALAVDPSAVAAHVNLGNALLHAGDIDGAVAALEAALRLRPDAPEVQNNLGNLYKAQGRFDDAIAAYTVACHAAPDFRPAFSNRLAATKLSTRHSAEEIFALHRTFAAMFEPAWRADYVPATNAPDPERRLRIGYVSPDCHTALPAFIEPVLSRHDRTCFDVYAYFNNPQAPQSLARFGPLTARVMKGTAEATVAQWVRDDGIDILIDIAGHTGHNRLGVFGRKPAPVQITWLDYLNTTGLDAIDYRLTDAVSDPPGASENLHSEALLRLAPAQWCWQPPGGIAEPGPLPMLASGRPTLGSFNNGSKLTDETLALWRRLMVALPQARLVVGGVPDGSAQARIRDALGDVGPRLRVLAPLPPDAFRREAGAVDVALDPRPFSGATTTLEMLWQGLPVVTWPGRTSASRSTASLLSALGLADWIAAMPTTDSAIVRRAVGAPEALAELRRTLPRRLLESALCDADRFTRNLEALLREAWRTWCARRNAILSGSDVTETRSSAPTSTQAALRRLGGDARLAAIDAHLRAGTGPAAVADACVLIDEFPEWALAQRTYLQTLTAWARNERDLVERVFPPPVPSRRPRFSVVVCSIDARKFDAVSASYRERFAGFPFEILGVHDARSLAEGYNRAAARATGDILVFSHDDIGLVTPDFAARLVAHLEHYDGIGVAGASRLAGPRWGDAGQRAIHGHILHAPPPGKRGVLMMVSGFQHPVCERIRVLDGVFIAVRRHVWETHRFDAERYDGFHLYDLDFTRRASDAGAKLAVPADLLIYHASLGRYGDAWRRYARRFIEQAGLDPLSCSPPGGLQVRLETQEQIDLLRAALVHFRYGAPVAEAAREASPEDLARAP